MEKKANINETDGQGNTPLHRAAEGGFLEIVNFLLEKGANPNLKNKEGKTPLDSAVNKGSSDVVKALQKKMTFTEGDWKRLLSNAVGGGSLDLVKDIMKQLPGLTIDEKNKLFRSGSSLEVLKYLKDQGANVDTKDNKEGRTLLYDFITTYSVSFDALKKAVEILGFSLTVKDNQALTPLQFAENRRESVKREKVKKRLDKIIDYLKSGGGSLQSLADALKTLATR